MYHVSSSPFGSVSFLILCQFFVLGTLPIMAEDSPVAKENLPTTVEEARGRARLLHESISGSLQLMHRDYFDPDDRDRIPSATLEEMFEAMNESFGVKLRWLGVNARTMDVDHEPQDQFERDAVAVLAKGKDEFERMEGKDYRFAGAIQLHNTCLKCHVPNRRSMEDRTAGLLIRMSLQ